MTTEIDDDETINQVVQALAERFPEKPEAEVRSIVAEEFSALAGRPVRDYLAILTERAAKKRLKKS